MSEKTMEEQVFGQDHELDTEVKPVALSIEQAIAFLKQNETE